MSTPMQSAALPEGSRVPDGLDDVAAALADRLPEHLDALVELASIPSISLAGNDPAHVRRSAEATADLLRGAGLEDVRLLEVDDAHPYVTGSLCHAGEAAPTLLLYAHHDVQPVGTPDRWSSPPFEPTVRDGRLYGRGCSDDKAGVIAHVAAIRAWVDARGEPPVNVKVVIEGEEEIGSPHLPVFLERYGPMLDADVIVIADVGNFKTGWPGLTWSLRGLMDATVTVRCMAQPVHSGMWGGLVPDALTATARLLATLHDDRGDVAVDGFAAGARELTPEERARVEALPPDPDGLRTEARTVEGLHWLGDPDDSPLERIWFTPTITPTGMSVPDLAHASNTLLNEVSTKLSCRMVPGQDPARAFAALRRHLEEHVPWGLEVEVSPGETAPAWVTDPSSAAHEAAAAAFEAGYGHDVAWMGCGGSIPLVGPFAESFGGAAALLIGVEDPASNAHGEDESQDLGDLARTALSEAYLFAELADRAEAVRARGA
ncbi:M20/M25/M40 family metallo-hydrolase [Salsipaludibacter albus]|uniref:M20/M25/M40 family metallo-hydrolase n=1 Tax=Salsipaludibacter albus TaxID=2849650 RepID=UPI001EE4BACF|nr:M20/M25/M40 family metallo-hydrolase [Salsipaludibacter albus]MBY5161795.1 M20/M25/M40 family metallo-hydrolase [Salsipaludibacter albus]